MFYLEPPEEVGVGADVEAVVVEVLPGGVDLGPLLRSPSLGIELPCLPPREVVQAKQVRITLAFSQL